MSDTQAAIGRASLGAQTGAPRPDNTLNFIGGTTSEISARVNIQNALIRSLMDRLLARPTSEGGLNRCGGEKGCDAPQHSLLSIQSAMGDLRSAVAELEQLTEELRSIF